MARDDTIGEVYLLHLDRPLKHARHYLGWAIDHERRNGEHESGNGSPMLRAAKAEGIGWTIARVWTGVTRRFERKLKNGGGSSRLCPLCIDDYRRCARERMRRLRARRKAELQGAQV